MSYYTKAIMAVVVTIVNGLAIYYGHTMWYPIVVSAVTALAVYFVPNVPKVPPTLTGADISKNYLQSQPTEPAAPNTDGWSEIK